jgi:hypothetical protein
MAAMLDEDRVQEIKDRLADRYTAAELCDLLDVPVEDIIEEYWRKILSRADVLSEVGAAEEEEEVDDLP